jgi:hypothetical protein
MASESINDFAIKLGVDATGVATGMKAANAIILQSQREMAKAETLEREINLQESLKDIEEKDKALERASQKHRRRLEEDARRFAAGAGRGDMQSMTVGGRIPVSEASIRAAREYVREVEMMNRLEQEAIGLKRQLMTAEQLHTARVAEYDAMLSRNILTQQEHAAAVAYSTRIAQASAGGFGGAGAAITQASYAAEDFIQVLSMGGGLNMALMSASNNLSMVARSVLGTNAAMGALAGFGVPALLIGLGMLVRYLMDTEDAAEKAKKALEDFRKETEHLGEMTKLRFEGEARQREIASMTDIEQVQQRIVELKQRQLELDEIMAMEEMKRAGANAAYFEGLMGGQEAVLDFQNRINKMTLEGTEQQKKAAEELGKLYAEARKEAIAGNEQNMLESLRKMHEMMTSNIGGLQDYMRSSNQLTDVSAWENLVGKFSDPLLLNAVQEIFQPNFHNMEENLALQKKIGEELVSQQEHMTKERQEQLMLVRDILKAQEQEAYLITQREGQATRERQQRMRDELEMMRMSEAEREMRRLRNEQAAFSGIDTAFVGPQLPISEEAFAQAFMDAQLAQVNKEIEQLRKPGYAQGLEQNTYDAQAKAFEQMFKAQFGPRDAQLERLDTLIEINRQLVEQGAQAPRVNVVPGG